ncbi:AzlC family ABC transporter permease [Streptomyces sp. NPDC092296]|uniref:AzlC family ABC transporter permease n=1 Tax=Streptomyces sp. NPDC092296 TaxID=3366012 RepID=UPI00381A5D26
MASTPQRAAPAAPTAPEGSRSSFVQGMRLGVSPGAATFVLALTYGAAAATHGWDPTATLLFSALAFSASAQFTLLAALSGGAAPAAVAAAALINVRYLVMGVALTGSLRGSRLWRALQVQALVDASFVTAHRGGGRFDIPRMVGCSVPQWVCWVAGSAAGRLLAPSPELMHDLGLDVAFPAFFLVLAMDEVRRSGRAVAAALLGAGVAAGLLFVVDPGSALLAATAAALIGALPARAAQEGTA